MKSFKVMWEETKSWVHITHEDLYVKLDYIQYKDICIKNNITLMRDIHDEIDHYIISTEFHAESHVKLNGSDRTMSLSFLNINPQGAIQAIINIQIFIDAMTPVIDEETPLLGHDNNDCFCIPKCTIT